MTIESKLEEAITYLKGELAKIRAGRASIDLFDDIEVAAYDTKLPLKQLATLSSPEARLVVVRPWDKGVLKDIETALRNAFSDLNPVVDGDTIRISFPSPTEERRQELVRYIGKIVEETRVKIRQTREEAIKDLKNQEDGGEISEDELFRKKEEAQNLIDEYNKKVEEIGRNKEEEVMTV